MSPIYVYNCEKCNRDQEELFPLTDRPDFSVCNQCGGKAQFAISAGHFIVNGANAANRYSGDSNFKWIGDKK